jgi:hypothetical protein
MIVNGLEFVKKKKNYLVHISHTIAVEKSTVDVTSFRVYRTSISEQKRVSCIYYNTRVPIKKDILEAKSKTNRVRATIKRNWTLRYAYVQ